MQNKFYPEETSISGETKSSKQENRNTKLFSLSLTVLFATFLLAYPCSANPGNATFNILQYGAVSDGITNNADAINRAIEAAADNNGGTVIIPAGKFVTGPVTLLSNVNLFLEAGAILSGSTNIEDYVSKVPGRRGSSEDTYNHLITATDCNNVSITGFGIIDGNAMAFMKKDSVLDLHYALTREISNSHWIQSNTRQGEDFMTSKLGEDKNPNPYLFGLRPNRMIQFRNCSNITIEGVTIQNAPNWTIAITGSEFINIRNAKIHSLDSDQRVPNDDGINISRSKYIHISNCEILTSDDAIALGGNIENLTITDCNLSSRDSGIRIGYMTSQMRNCIFNNLNIFESTRGILINIRRSGTIENMIFDNITIQTRLFAGYWWGKGEPIQISSLPLEGTTDPGVIRNLRFSNIIAECEAGIIVYGCEESIIKDIHFDNIHLKILAGPNAETLGGNFDLRGAVKPELAIFKHDIPAIFCKHVEGITISNFKLEWGNNLPGFFTNAISCEDFHGLLIDGLYARQANATSIESTVRLFNGSRVTIKNSEALPGTNHFLSLEKTDGGVIIMNNNFSQSRAAYTGDVAGIKTSGNIMP
jgi:polygalacturonase